MKASHGARNELLAEALGPEADCDPHDPDDRALNEDANVCTLVTVKMEFWVPSQHPITTSNETDTASSQIQSTEERLWKEFFGMILLKRSLIKLYRLHSYSYFSWNILLCVGHSQSVIATDDRIQQFISGMALESEILVEKSTRTQADSKLWLAFHNGRNTSSRFGEILRRKDSTDPSVLVKSLMGYNWEIVCTAALKWGKDNKDRAHQMYIKDRAEAAEIMSVRETGLTLCPSMPS